VAISNSGRTPEVVAAAERHRGRSFVLALTGHPDSPLARAASVALPLVAVRAEAGGISVLSYRSTVAALHLLAAEVEPLLAATGVGAAVPALEALLADRTSWLADAGDLVEAARPVHVLGDGSRAGAIAQAALMLREGPRIEAIPCDTGDWLHVGLYTLFPGDTAVLFRGSPADDEVIATIHARGGRVLAVGEPHPDADAHVPLPSAALEDPVIRSLVEPAVADLLAAELWGRADAAVTAEGEDEAAG
jgi:fructoselysine-6-P-deglycase FrlB-like protein